MLFNGPHPFAQVTRHAGVTSPAGAGKQRKPELRWVNTFLGNLKTALAGTYHSFDHAHYGARYLAESAYRFNRRCDLAAMLPGLLRAAARTRPLPLRVMRLTKAGS